MSTLTAEARARLQASRAVSNPMPTAADVARMDSTERSNARMRFRRRGWPIPEWLKVLPRPTRAPLDDPAEALGPSDSHVRKLRLARLARRGYPKTVTCLGCSRPMRSEGPGHRLHQACRTEAHPFNVEHAA